MQTQKPTPEAQAYFDKQWSALTNISAPKPLEQRETLRTPCENTKKWGMLGGFDKFQQALGTDIDGFFRKMRLNRPDFSRWNLAINFSQGSNRSGYSCYPSYDWRPLNKFEQLAYDEENGLKLLINYMIELKIYRYNLATIFGAYTFGSLENSKFPHKQKICVFKGGYVESFPQMRFEDYTDEAGAIRRRLNVKESLQLIADGVQNKAMIQAINSRIQRNNLAA